MHRRGPDHTAYRRWTNNKGRNTYLLHSRLSIIDLDPRAHQPFQHGSKWIVLNGELYNYREVRNKLEAAGNSFRTSSDTEVLLQAIDQGGTNILDQCEGMWAFAIYDEASGDLLLSRDRFGEKPLWLYRTPDGVYFASEIKFICTLLEKSIPVNVNTLLRFMINGYKALYKSSETFFHQLEELPRASVLNFSGEGEERLWKYWTPVFQQNLAMSISDAVKGTRERLIHSVELRLRADVPLAFCMSGGVDSNALISIAKRVFDYNVHGFTIVNTDTRYEENDLVTAAVKELEIRHSVIPIQRHSFIERMRELVRYHDAPVYTITYFAHWLLMQAIAENGYRISLSGTAADELFSGYYDHYLAYLFEVRKEPDFSRSLENWETYIKPTARNPYLKDPKRFIQDPNFRDHLYLNADDFSGYFYRPWKEEFAEQNYCSDLLRNRMANEIFHEATPVILHEDDLNAMYFSVENRSPYLDRHLFEFSSTIPTKHLIQNGYAKAILRKAMDGIVPNPILENRKKVGFNAPIFDFLDRSDPDVGAYLLDDSPIFDIIRKDKIAQLLKKGDLPNSESKFLFYFLSSKLFLEEFGK